MSRTEGLSTESFIKRASSTRMTGMRISIMEILLLMMLLLCEQKCRLHLGPRLTSPPASHVRRTLRPEAIFDELRSNHIFVWWQYYSHGEVFRHGCQECCTNLVLLSSARNNHVMAEAEGHADYPFSRFSNKAGHRSSFILVHPGSRRIPSGVCPKVLASEGTGTNGAQ
jgi:hypothetical protein